MFYSTTDAVRALMLMKLNYSFRSNTEALNYKKEKYAVGLMNSLIF
jgi:hypothetical protein